MLGLVRGITRVGRDTADALGRKLRVRGGETLVGQGPVEYLDRPHHSSSARYVLAMIDAEG
jgi:hypothetical protein